MIKLFGELGLIKFECFVGSALYLSISLSFNWSNSPSPFVLVLLPFLSGCLRTPPNLSLSLSFLQRKGNGDGAGDLSFLRDISLLCTPLVPSAVSEAHAPLGEFIAKRRLSPLSFRCQPAVRAIACNFPFLRV